MKLFFVIGKRSVFVMGITLALALLLAASAAGTAVVQTAASNRLLPIYSVGRADDDKVVSLSFDAAWGNEDTQQLIDICEKYGVKVTFFVVGDWVDKYPESVKALSDAGHEIMNHSTDHPHMPQLSSSDMAKQITDCNDKIEAITGKRPILFRAPYGEYDNTLINTLDSLGMYCIQWDVDSLDWKELSAKEISDRVLSKVRPGSIVLFHNAALHTPEALPGIIESLLADGYKIVPISENIYKDNFVLDHEGRQQLKSEPVQKKEESDTMSSEPMQEEKQKN